jgi:hypothetical protein
MRVEAEKLESAEFEKYINFNRVAFRKHNPKAQRRRGRDCHVIRYAAPSPGGHTHTTQHSHLPRHSPVHLLRGLMLSGGVYHRQEGSLTWDERETGLKGHPTCIQTQKWR